MRNLTITVDEEVARWAKVWAAQHDTSVSRFVGQLLRDRMLLERRYETAQKQYVSVSPKPLKRSGSYPSREELHDRKGLR